jgi:hypothetical protein
VKTAIKIVRRIFVSFVLVGWTSIYRHGRPPVKYLPVAI